MSEKYLVDEETKPELDGEWFTEANAYVGDKLVQRGQPRFHQANPSVAPPHPEVIN